MFRQRKGFVLWLCLLLILMAILVSSVSCWGSPLFELIVENQTEYDLTIYVNDFKMGNVSPGGQISDRHFSIDTGKFHIEAKNEDGGTIFSKTLTFEQMQEIKSRVYKVVISPT